MTRHTRTAVRASVWLVATALVVLGSRSLVYMLAPQASLVGSRLEYEAGGPRLVVLALTAIVLAAALSGAVVWLVAVAICERSKLELLAAPIRRTSVRGITARAVGLWLVSSIVFALVESYLHWRAGLGWHGIHCLVGPVHRDAIPVLAALSLLASALVAVLEQLVGWMRRVVASLCTRSGRRPTGETMSPPIGAPRPCSRDGKTGSPRAPPRLISACQGRPTGSSTTPMTRRSADMTRSRMSRGGVALTVSTVAALVLSSAAWAHAELSPAVAKAKTLQLFTLAVPTEEEGATTTTIEFTPPAGFGIDSFVPAAGWKRSVQATGSGEDAVIQKVTWSGGSTPTEEDSVFQFLASPSASKTYTFSVRQTYSSGKIVDWNGSESSDTPAPTIEAKSSLGGGGSSTLSLVALVVGALGLLLGGLALAGGKRQLA